MKRWCLLLTAFLIACVSDENPNNLMEEQPDGQTEEQAVSLRYLALGDSYTIGESVEEAERWPVQLVTRLQSDSLLLEVPEIVATTGWTTAELKEGIAKAAPAGPFDLVSLLIGVNNQYRGPEKGYTLGSYRQEFEELLQQSIGFAGNRAARVFVVSIPDYGVTPFAAARDTARIARELDEYNLAAKEICERYQVAFHDITPGSRLARTDPGLVAADGLHPSGKMYQQWVAQIFEPVKESLLIGEL